MAYDNPMRASCHALMQFVGENLDPEQIASLLPLQPWRSKKKGEALGSRPGHPVPLARQGVLSFSTSNVDSNDINEHLRYFLKGVLRAATELKSLVHEHHLRWVIVCFFDNPPSDLRAALEKSIVNSLDNLGIELIVDDPTTVEFVEDASTKIN